MRTLHFAAAAILVTSASCNLPYPALLEPDAGPLPGMVTIDVANGRQFVRTGERVAIDVTLTRGTGADGDVAVTLASPPAGVTAEPLTIPAGATSGVLMINAAVTSGFGRGDVVVDAALGTVVSHDTLDLDVIGARGALDTSFGDAGTVTMESLVSAAGQSAVVLPQSDKVVVVTTAQRGGSLGLYALRLDPKGVRDLAFGTAGSYFDDLSSIGLSVSSVTASQHSGAIVIAGTGNKSLQTPYLVQLTADGAVDATLPLETVETPSVNEAITAVAVDSQGRIVLGGSSGAVLSSANGLLLRTSPHGVLDAGWGHRIVGTANDGSSITSLAVEADDGVVLLLKSCQSNCPGGLVRRANPDGSPDATFTASALPQAYAPSIEGLGLRSATSFRVWGEDDGAGGHKRAMMVWGALDDGTPDPQFSIFEAAPGVKHQILVDVEPLPGGGLIGIGYETDGTAADHQLTMVELSDGGKLDTSFGTSGILTETSVVFEPRAAAPRIDHRITIYGVMNAGLGSAQPAVRTYFW